MESIIKHVLEKTGMSQKEFAEKLYVTPQAVSKWVRGESRPSVDNVERIFEITGINIMEMTSTTRCSRKIMRTKSLNEIYDYDKAKQEAVSVLETARIKENYSYPTYKLCCWLLPAVICLIYHQRMLMCAKERDADGLDHLPAYDDIFYKLLDWFDTESLPRIVKGLYENTLEYDMYIMGMDLFESCGDDRMPDHDYCSQALDDWYRFERALIKSNNSPVYNEFLVAIMDIGDCYGICSAF